MPIFAFNAKKNSNLRDIDVDKVHNIAVNVFCNNEIS
jgi:hypothetical protein